MANNTGQEDCVNIAIGWGPITVTCNDNATLIRTCSKVGSLTYTEQNISAKP
jgi:hypothetical protein